MTKESTLDTAAKALTPGVANMERMMELTRNAMSKALSSRQKVLEANLETSAEMFSFMSRRLQAQAEFWSKLAHCHAAEEALGAQRDFATEMTRDYSAEVTHLAERTADIAQANYRTLTEQLTESAEEVTEAAASKGAKIAEVA